MDDGIYKAFASYASELERQRHVNKVMLEACRAVAAQDDRYTDADYLIHITTMQKIKAAIKLAEGKE